MYSMIFGNSSAPNKWILKRYINGKRNVVMILPFQWLLQHQSLAQIPKPKQLLILRLIPKLILARSCSNVCTHPVLTAWDLTWEGFTGWFPRGHACDSQRMSSFSKEWTCVFAWFASTVFQQKTLRPLSFLGSVCGDSIGQQIRPGLTTRKSGKNLGGRPSSHQNMTNAGTGRWPSWGCYNLPMILLFLCASGVATMKNH